MSDQLRDQLNNLTSGIATSMDMSEMLSYSIWGAAVTTTRAFEKVTLRVDTNSNRIFVSVKLRWWATFEKFKRLQDAWLSRCEDRVKEHIPEGWKVLVYYERSKK
jgi:hypothetical protein